MELICKIGIYERKKVGEEGQTDRQKWIAKVKRKHG